MLVSSPCRNLRGNNYFCLRLVTADSCTDVARRMIRHRVIYNNGHFHRSSLKLGQRLNVVRYLISKMRKSNFLITELFAVDSSKRLPFPIDYLSKSMQVVVVLCNLMKQNHMEIKHKLILEIRKKRE